MLVHINFVWKEYLNMSMLTSVWVYSDKFYENYSYYSLQQCEACLYLTRKIPQVQYCPVSLAPCWWGSSSWYLQSHSRYTTIILRPTPTGGNLSVINISRNNWQYFRLCISVSTYISGTYLTVVPLFQILLCNLVPSPEKGSFKKCPIK